MVSWLALSDLLVQQRLVLLALIILAPQSMGKLVVDAVREHVKSRVGLSVEAIAFIALVLLTPEVIFKRLISRQVVRAT